MYAHKPTVYPFLFTIQLIMLLEINFVSESLEHLEGNGHGAI